MKPGNVLLADDGTVKITDFGISKAIEDVGTTTSGMLLGTPAYLSPEVAKGEEATFASDVFSLGATLFRAVEGTPPVGSGDNTMALLYKVASGDVAEPASAGPMTDILRRMLRRDPSDRPTMTEVRDTLTALGQPEPDPSPEPASAPARVEPRLRRRTRSAVWVMVGLAMLALASVALVLVLDQSPQATPTAAPTSTASQPPSSSSSSLSSSSSPEPPPANQTNESAPPPTPTSAQQSPDRRPSRSRPRSATTTRRCPVTCSKRGPG
ncbi:hypothetical protein GCM10029964_086670 [Kibdelosporangium lantanae]